MRETQILRPHTCEDVQDDRGDILLDSQTHSETRGLFCVDSAVFEVCWARRLWVYIDLTEK